MLGRIEGVDNNIKRVCVKRVEDIPVKFDISNINAKGVRKLLIVMEFETFCSVGSKMFWMCTYSKDDWRDSLESEKNEDSHYKNNLNNNYIY